LTSPEKNRLLNALPPADRARIYPHLKLISLPFESVLYEAGDTQRYIYFPVDSIVSLLYVLKNGASAEIAVVGNDGAIGIALFMGFDAKASRKQRASCRRPVSSNTVGVALPSSIDSAWNR
jgi:hypothetical protein